MVIEKMADTKRSLFSNLVDRLLAAIVMPLVFVSLLLATASTMGAQGQQGELRAIDFKAVDLEGQPFNGLDLEAKPTTRTAR